MVNVRRKTPFFSQQRGQIASEKLQLLRVRRVPKNDTGALREKLVLKIVLAESLRDAYPVSQRLTSLYILLP
jgi:hypothetical protein